MDEDLQVLLAAWLGDHDPGDAGRDALISRLRDDADFRRAFIVEIHLLGRLKAVQSAEPRWLRLEDLIGWSSRRGTDEEALAAGVVREARRRARRRVLQWSAAIAAAVLLAVGLTLALRPHPSPAPPGVDPGADGLVADAAGPGRELATAVRIEGVRWDGGQSLTEGSVVSAGRLRLREGRLTLAFFSGVALTVEGPADIELLAANRVFCHHGKLRVRAPLGAEGFTVLADGYEVVDLGTEFGLNREPGGKSRIMVFHGEAAVSVLGRDGRPVRGALLDGRSRTVEVDLTAGRIQDVAPEPKAFVPLGEFVRAPLDLDPGYAAEVRAANPWGYWRFESAANGRIPNEVAGRPPLAVLGGVVLEQSPGGNGWAYFRPEDPVQALLMDGEWTPPRAGGYAIELWVQADLPSPAAFSQSALVSLIDRMHGPSENHLAYLELTARGRRSSHEPCAVRFLDRWPTALSGGADVFSRRSVVPSLWHHVVGQKAGDLVELYIDGECVGTTPAKSAVADGRPTTTACGLLVGRLKQRSLPPHTAEIRPFEGRLDELAVYDHPLTPEEIRRHAGLRAALPEPAAPKFAPTDE